MTQHTLASWNFYKGRDVFHISAFLVFAALGQLLQNMLTRSAPLASVVVRPLRELLTPMHVAVTLGQT